MTNNYRSGVNVFAALMAAFSLLVGSVRAEGFQWRKEPPDAFRAGERIEYRIKYGLVNSGSASLEVTGVEEVNGRATYHLASRARTNKSLDVFFKVRDENDSWMDVLSLCSQRFQQKVREGGYAKETLTTYNHPDRRFEHSHRGKHSKEPHTYSGDIPPFVQDPLSALYYLRTVDLQVGQEHLIDANSGGKTWPLKVRVEAREEVKVPAGKFLCFRVEPVMAGEGIFMSKGRLEVWITADQRRIPVLLRSKVAVGSFNAEMTSYTSP